MNYLSAYWGEDKCLKTTTAELSTHSIAQQPSKASMTDWILCGLNLLS